MERQLLEFENTFALVEYAKTHKNNSMWEKKDLGFYGCRDNKEAMKLAKYGWHSGAKAVYDKQLKLKTGLENNKLAYSYDVVGDVLDMGSYLSGEPECWLQQAEIDTKPEIDIVVNISIASFVTQDVVNNRGALIVSLIDHLSNAYNISLKVYAGSRRDYQGIDLFVNLGNSPLDIDGVAFAVAHPAFFRYLCTAAVDNYFEISDVGTWSPIEYENRDRETIYFPNISRPMLKKYKTIKSSKIELDKLIKKYERV
jgi:hypothetical protein